MALAMRGTVVVQPSPRKLPAKGAYLATFGVAYLAMFVGPGPQSPVAAAPVRSAPQVSGIAAVTFRVGDLAGARGFYGDLLGLEEIGPREGKRLRFRVGDRQSIELVPGPAGADGRLERVVFAARGLAPGARRRPRADPRRARWRRPVSPTSACSLGH